MFIGGELGYRILRLVSPPVDLVERHLNPSTHRERPDSGLESWLSAEDWKAIDGKVVIDFGCGVGGDAIALAQRGARHVIGIEVRDWVIDQATDNARAAGVLDRCTFTRRTDERADIITCSDVFEHVDDLEGVLAEMHRLLTSGGQVLAAFGPPWYHPYGAHLLSVFPWAHLLFTERALTRWRSAFAWRPITHFSESGLNGMTVRRFIETVARSPLRFAHLDLTPIRRLGLLHNRLTREFTTAVVYCRLVRRGE